MKQFDFLIIGGGAAGTTAAQVIRSLKPESSIAILCEEDYEMYSRVLLPSYIRGEITKDQLFLKKREWYSQNRIDLVKNAKVSKIDPSKKNVETESGETYQFGKLLIAVGAKPIKLNALGSDLENISYMWTLPDAEKIIEAAKISKKGLIIGGGFIGLEFAHSFKAKGIETVLLDGAPHYWGNRLDPTSSVILEKILKDQGIEIITGDQVEKFVGADGKVTEVVTKSGRKIDCDLVGIGIGIRSDLAFLQGSGIKVEGGILTNEYLETNVPDIYAAGDCAAYYDTLIEAPHIVGTWANATTQGAIVGKTMAGVKTPFEAVSSYTINFFGASCSFIGMTEASFADEIIERGSIEASRMSRLFLKNYPAKTQIVGATLINTPAEVAPLVRLCKERTNVDEYLPKMKDLDFDLAQIK